MLGSADMVDGVEGSVRVASGTRLIKLCPRCLALALVALACTGGRISAQAPDEDWRTLETEHFRVTFPRGLETLGRRAAARAEAAYEGLERTLLDPGGGTIDLLVTDNVDVSNGWAQVKPSRRVTVYATQPTDGLQLAYYDDWLDLVITHELAHVFHLDHTSNPIGRLGRAVFGRAPTDWPLFPGVSTPDWVIEGLATWYESKLTDAGRLRGTYHEMEIRTAILEGRFESLGQASGRSPLWPGGNRSYLYGSVFFEYLTERYGEDAMSSFVEAVAGQWIPFRIDAAARTAFGVSFSDAWGEWEEGLGRRYADLDRELSALGPVSEPERLTHGARWALQPKVSPDGRVLTYTQADGRSDVQLRRSEPDGSMSRQLTRTNGVASYDWMPDGRLLVSQLENSGPYSAFGDLWVVDLDGGSRRLTRGARLSEPSASPDGTWAAAIQQTDGTNVLVRVDTGTGAITRLTQPDPGAHWAFPSISPDGRWIAVTRWDEGAWQDIVVLDVDGRLEPRRLMRDRAVDLAASWSPDGRWLVWASDRSGISNILAAPFDAATGATGEPRLLTNVRTGAAYPSVDPSGEWLYLSAYHADGWEAERMRFRPSAAAPAPPVAPRFAPSDGAAPMPDDARGPVGGFSPLHTLWPRYWEPRFREALVAPAQVAGGLDLRRRELMGFAVGAETSAVDLVGRHEYTAYAQVFTSGGRAEGGLSYTYRGLGNPIFSLSARQSWASAGRIVAPPDTFYVVERDRSVGLSMTLLSRRWRRDVALALGGDLAWAGFQQLDNDLRTVPLDPGVPDAPRFGGVSASFAYSSAREHSFQTGNTRGMSVYLQGRRRIQLDVPTALRGVTGSDYSYDELYGRARAYVPLWRAGHETHVLALQAAGGSSFGPQGRLGRFGVGGASGSPEDVTGFTLFGGELVPLPVRGYGEFSRFGRWAWAATAEYRFPVALLHHGLGAWPLHLDRVVGSLFTDVGNAWEPTPRGDPLVSVGAELSARLLALYNGSLLLRTGLAVPLVGTGGPSVYVRVGMPF
jgi:hypothetical protein